MDNINLIIQPEEGYVSPSSVPTISVIYEYLTEDEEEKELVDIKLEIDITSDFNSAYKQTQTFAEVESGEEKHFTISELKNGYWYYRITAATATEEYVSEIREIEIAAGMLKRTLSVYENIGRQSVRPKKRTLSTYVNKAKFGPMWNRKRILYNYESIVKQGPYLKRRGLYQYENRTDDPPFPTIYKLSASKVEAGTIITITGNGFGFKSASDIDNKDRFQRGYGGKVFIGDTECGVISWSWTKLVVQIPNEAKTGAVKVRLTQPKIIDSNLIGLEVIEVQGADDLGLEFFVCEANNPNKILAQLDGAKGKAFQMLLNNPGSGSFSISRDDEKGSNRDYIKDQNFILCRIGGVDVFKWIIESRNPDYVNSNEQQKIGVSGRGILAILENAVVYPKGMPSPKELDRKFNAPAGNILRTLILEAQARGVLQGIEIDWTSGADSLGEPFTDSTEISFHAGTPLTEVINKLAEGLGMFDVVMTPQMKLRLFNRLGEDRSRDIVYMPGKGVLSHSNSSDAKELTNVLLVEGEDGKLVETAHRNSQSKWGRREGYLQARNTSNGLSEYGQKHLDKKADPFWGIQCEVIEYLDHKREIVRPLKSYDIGDWIGWRVAPKRADTKAIDSKLRVKGITFNDDDETGAMSYNLDLNNIVSENEIKMKQNIERMSMYTQDSSLSSPSTEAPASRNHNHTHGTLKRLNTDDHVQYLNKERHANIKHDFIQRVSGIRVEGEENLTGGVSLKVGNNITLNQDNTNKTITINSTGEGGGTGGTIPLLTTSYIGSYRLDNSGTSLTTRESFWNRVICLESAKINEVSCNIAEASSDVKLIIAKTDKMSGNCTKGDVVLETEYQQISSPPYKHTFSDFNIELTKDKLYVFIIESESGANLSVFQEERVVLGQGSLLPSTNDLGGYATRDSNVLTEYGNSLPWMHIKYS